MKIEEVRSKTDEELDFELNGMKKELFEQRLKAKSGTVSNTARIRHLRRSVARVTTVLRERAKNIRGQEAR